MTESLEWSLGGLSLPFAATDVSDTTLTFEPADPANSLILDLLEAAIKAEWTEAWTKVCAGLTATPTGFSVTNPVADKLPLPPTQQNLTQRKAAWPLLCLHRQGEAEYEDDGNGGIDRLQKWMAHLILGPLDVGSQLKLASHYLPAVASTVALTLSRGAHPNYQSGAQQFGPQSLEDDAVAVLDSCRLLTSEVPVHGVTYFEGVTYHALLMTLETAESTGPDEQGAVEFSDMWNKYGIGDGSGAVQDLVITDGVHRG